MKPILAVCHLLTFIVLPSAFVLAQTTISFSVSQPDLPFLVDAGEDQIYIGDDIILGGAPTASGGFEAYAYSWEPSELLDDPTSPNPTIMGISGPVTFTLTCTDELGNCIKEDEVFVDYQLSTSQLNQAAVKAYPNPFDDRLVFESDQTIYSITIYDIRGKVVSMTNNPPLQMVQETSSLNSGLYLVQIQLENGLTQNFKLCKRD